jgi:hypothetical protein
VAKEVGTRLGTREVLFQEVCRGSEGGSYSTQRAVTDLIDAVLTPAHRKIKKFDLAPGFIDLGHNTTAHTISSWLNTPFLPSEW